MENEILWDYILQIIDVQKVDPTSDLYENKQ